MMIRVLYVVSNSPDPKTTRFVMSRTSSECIHGHRILASSVRITARGAACRGAFEKVVSTVFIRIIAVGLTAFKRNDTIITKLAMKTA